MVVCVYAPDAGCEGSKRKILLPLFHSFVLCIDLVCMCAFVCVCLFPSLSPFLYTSSGGGYGFGLSPGQFLGLSAIELAESIARENRRQAQIKQQVIHVICNKEKNRCNI